MKTHILTLNCRLFFCLTARRELKWSRLPLELHPGACYKQAIGHYNIRTSARHVFILNGHSLNALALLRNRKGSCWCPAKNGEITATL